jgi:hypothetical protein
MLCNPLTQFFIRIILLNEITTLTCQSCLHIFYVMHKEVICHRLLVIEILTNSDVFVDAIASGDEFLCLMQ